MLLISTFYARFTSFALRVLFTYVLGTFYFLHNVIHNCHLLGCTFVRWYTTYVWCATRILSDVQCTLCYIAVVYSDDVILGKTCCTHACHKYQRYRHIYVSLCTLYIMQIAKVLIINMNHYVIYCNILSQAPFTQKTLTLCEAFFDRFHVKSIILQRRDACLTFWDNWTVGFYKNWDII